MSLLRLEEAWEDNDFESFAKNYETNTRFLSAFFKLYKELLDGNKSFEIEDENKFLELVIKLEDELMVVKYMKMNNLNYKKLIPEYS